MDIQPVPGTLSVVAPVYNNEGSLDELVARTLRVFDEVGVAGELVLVDDGSGDGSWKRIVAASEADARVVGVKLSRNFGQHPAIAAGLQRAGGDHIVLMDADLQDRPEEIPRLLEPFRDDVDVVFTTWVPASGTIRERWTSRLFHQTFSRLAGVNLPANLGTFRAMTAAYRDEVLEYPEQGAVYGPLMAQMGFEQGWVDVVRDDSAAGGSSYSFRKRLALAMNTIVTYADLPYRLLMWGGSGLMLVTFVYLLVVLGQYAVSSNELPSGLTLVLSTQVLLSGAILLGVGILGNYVHRVFREVLRRPRYHVNRRVGRGLGDDR
jgi:dolichol-phosphate mannosyltransferase